MFQAGVSSTDDNDIEKLFGKQTPGADDILNSSQRKDEGKDASRASDSSADNAAAGQDRIIATNEEEVDTLFEDVDQDNDSDNSSDDKNREDKNKAKPGPKAKSKLPENAEVNYEAIYNDMVTQGLWDEVEVPDGVEWNKELFQQVQTLQAKSKQDDLFNKIGPIGKSIVEYEQNGGNPSELINLFREQRDVQEYDITSSEGQEEFLRAYLEAQEYSDKSVDRIIKSLKDQGDEILKEEAEEKKSLWDKQYQEAIENRKMEQQLESKRVQDAAKEFQKIITDTLTSDTDETPKTKKDLQSYMLNYNQAYKGKTVSQFYVDMAEIQKDPKNYVELAKFVKGLKNGDYTKKIADKVQKTTAVNSYLKIKGGASLKIGGGSDPDLQSGNGGEPAFVRLLKK